jgi:pimeloyl-ACP methyl ester carboxylesterase
VAPRLAAEGTIDGASGKLWYRMVGRGPDTVLVPLGTWLEPGLAALGDRHTLVFFDPRHRGRSHALTDSMAATFDGDVADVEAVRMAMGSPRVAVIGYDYYAGVAAAWAATHPQAVTRIILLSPIEPADSLSRTWNPPERMTRLDTTAARALVKARAAGKDTSDATGYCEQFWRVNMRLFVSDTVRANAIRPEWCQWPKRVTRQSRRCRRACAVIVRPGDRPGRARGWRERADAGDPWQAGSGRKSRGCPGMGAADQRRTGPLA